MQYAGWTNRDNRSFTISFDDTEVGVHMTGHYSHRETAQDALERCRSNANDARERAGLERTDRPD